MTLFHHRIVRFTGSIFITAMVAFQAHAVTVNLYPEINHYSKQCTTQRNQLINAALSDEHNTYVGIEGIDWDENTAIALDTQLDPNVSQGIDLEKFGLDVQKPIADSHIFGLENPWIYFLGLAHTHYLVMHFAAFAITITEGQQKDHHLTFMQASVDFCATIQNANLTGVYNAIQPHCDSIAILLKQANNDINMIDQHYTTYFNAYMAILGLAPNTLYFTEYKAYQKIGKPKPVYDTSEIQDAVTEYERWNKPTPIYSLLKESQPNIINEYVSAIDLHRTPFQADNIARFTKIVSQKDPEASIDIIIGIGHADHIQAQLEEAKITVSQKPACKEETKD
ncbi:MAG: hypothetical protein KDK51_06875 [Deltaproteobacteria bacterium]|nr:hypothetical protein [Deltaproteobacteria bacterium]